MYRIIRFLAAALALVTLCSVLIACGEKISSKTYTWSFDVDTKDGSFADIKSVSYSYTLNESGSYRLTNTIFKKDGKTESRVTESGTYYVREENGESKITFTYYEGEEANTHTYSFEKTDWYIEIGGQRYTAE